MAKRKTLQTHAEHLYHMNIYISRLVLKTISAQVCPAKLRPFELSVAFNHLIVLSGCVLPLNTHTLLLVCLWRRITGLIGFALCTWLCGVCSRTSCSKHAYVWLKHGCAFTVSDRWMLASGNSSEKGLHLEKSHTHTLYRTGFCTNEYASRHCGFPLTVTTVTGPKGTSANCDWWLMNMMDGFYGYLNVSLCVHAF